MSNLQTYYHFKLDFQKVDQHTGCKWLIHSTKRRGLTFLTATPWFRVIYHGDHTQKNFNKFQHEWFNHKILPGSASEVNQKHLRK